MKELIRVLGFERTATAAGHYRLVQPLYKLLQHGMANILTIHDKNAQDIDFVTQKIVEAEVIVFQRPADEKWYNFIKTAQKYGKAIVADYDDDLFNVHPLNPSYRFHGIKEVTYQFEDGRDIKLWEDGVNRFSIETNLQRRYLFRANFKKADMVSTTTDILKDVFMEINKNTIVLPNVIDFDIFQPIEMKKKEIRIGWQGGNSHYHDLYMIVPAIKKLIKKHDNVKFVFFGDMGFKGLFKDVPEGRIEWQHWVKHVAYPYKLMTLNYDIGLCPIVNDAFNISKSALKYFEYSALKIPTIASNIPPYSKVMTNGKDGILVEDDKWFEAMEELVADKEKRNKFASKAYDNVFENHNADKTVHLWLDAYTKLLKRDVSTLIEE